MQPLRLLKRCCSLSMKRRKHLKVLCNFSWNLQPCAQRVPYTRLYAVRTYMNTIRGIPRRFDNNGLRR